jgi:hypothetical protein
MTSGRRPRSRIVTPAVFVLVAVASLGWVLVGGGGPEARRREAPERVRAPAPPPPGLMGAARPARPAASGAGRPRAAGREEAAGAATLGARRDLVRAGRVDPEHVALAPDAVRDEVREAARPPLEVPLRDLIGAVGPYGVRDDPPPQRWLGLARLERPVGEAPQDEVTEPLATGVVGRVTAEDGSPVAGAEVILYTSFYQRRSRYDHRVREIGRVYTGEDGGFDLRPVDLDTVHFGRDGEVLVTVRHPAYADLVAQRLAGLQPGRDSDVGGLVLPAQSAVVQGRVLDRAGAPVAGAVVRASGRMNPVQYDKSERMVVLSACPSATTDGEGRYRLTDFAPGVHEISVHVNLDCVVHVAGRWRGERTWSPRVRAGHAVRGVVIGPDGRPIRAAVVQGGGNWTPTNADGTFWLDNVDPGPLTLQVWHDAWAHATFPDVPTDAEDVTLALSTRLPRVTLEVVDAAGHAVTLVDVVWTWAPGRGPTPFTPDSPHWYDPHGVFDVTVPEGAAGARLAAASPGTPQGASLGPDDLVDGRRVRVELAPPEAPGQPEADR